MNNIGASAMLIKKYRKAKGLSQQDLAAKAGVSRIAIVRYENQQQTPSLQSLSKIAKALDVSVAKLMDRETKINIIEKDRLFDDVISLLGYKIERYDLGKTENERYYKLIKNNKALYISTVQLYAIQISMFDLVDAFLMAKAFKKETIPTNSSSEPDEQSPNHPDK